MRDQGHFFNLYNHDFIRLAVAIPRPKIADPEANATGIIELLKQVTQDRAAVALFPELTLSAYSCDDLFHQRALVDDCEAALARVLEASKGLALTAVVGLPVQVNQQLFNCAAVLCQGRLLGVVPKTYLPNYREYYEQRHFAPAAAAGRDTLTLAGQADVPFSNRLLFRATNQPLLNLYVEVCEDLWSPIPPSSFAALAGATVIVNPSASNITVGKADYRRQLVGNQSARCLAAYAYGCAGSGESTTDLAWDGHALVFENGSLVAESERFRDAAHTITADIDLGRLSQDRVRQMTYSQTIQNHRTTLADFRTIDFTVELPRRKPLPLRRAVERFPYVPADPAHRDRRCQEVYNIQVQGLVQRLRASHLDKVIIGISGGLDSTQGLIVCAQAMDVLGLPRHHIYAYTMPGFATSDRTLEQAHQLMATVGCRAEEIDIRPSCLQMLKDIGHPYADGEAVYDITFENVQAGERTSHLFRLANHHGGLVVGTSDLSELALGWCTYGVGDHMAHYHVNASVPKTLIQYLIGWAADTNQLGAEANQVLRKVLATDISPELVPGAEAGEKPAQRSEDVIGPYGLQDFNLYYILRFGHPPPKVAFLAYSAWGDVQAGRWPDTIADEQHRAYTIGEIKTWLGVFLKRFFHYSQYKRSCIANAPKVGSGGSLSPRGDYRAPADTDAATWLRQLDYIPDSDG